MTKDRTQRTARVKATGVAADERGAAREPFPIVGIGASAGGLEAFTELLAHLPLDTGMAFVLVQHLDPLHESALAQLLARATLLPVREVTHNLRVEANNVYVIPPNTSLRIAKGVLKLERRRKSPAPHRSIDLFFESLAQDQRERAIGVVLSGTATDGTLGLEAIRAEGGITFAQDESARYDSMPRSAVAAGCVDFVLSPASIAKELAGIAAHPHVAGELSELLDTARDHLRSAAANEAGDAAPSSGGRRAPRRGAQQARAGAESGGQGTERASATQDIIGKILVLLRNHSRVDFSLYKPSTIQRRITRRMAISKHAEPADYLRFLEGNVRELDALYSDALISVTGFFRNPEAFDVLQRKVLPKLLKQGGDEPIRAWVLGCSSGQEAYSIAMAFVEAAGRSGRMRQLQVFATDLNDALLDRARRGLYPKSLANDLSPERLRRFFVEEDGGYRIGKPLREMVVFARQNVISDPPFSRMDLVSCRNLLIYLQPSLQRKVFPVLHYALKPDGFLFLGASESIAGFGELFEPLDRKHKIYCKKAAPILAFQLPVRKERAEEPSSRRSRKAAFPLATGRGQSDLVEGFRAEQNTQREADRVTIQRFAPPGILIDAQLQILQFRGSTGAYLEPPTGKASFDLLKMAREGLLLPLRAAINKAEKDNRTARKENVRIEQNGRTRTVNLEVIPLRNLREPRFLILFEDAKKAGAAAPAPEGPAAGGRRSGEAPARAGQKPHRAESPRRIAQLEHELAETRDYLQSVQEQYEATNEELQASNEEVQSANEEFQSLNEELETSKEELESTNEELVTVNEEMVNRNAELSRLNSDLVNVQTSAHLAIVLLGRDLSIRRFSAQAGEQLKLVTDDVGRPFGYVRHGLDLPDVESFVREVIDTGRERQLELRDREGRWLSLRVSPYLGPDNLVDGAVLVLVDIDALKRSELAVAAARDYAEHIIATVRQPLLVLDSELRVESANRSFYRTFGGAPTSTVGEYLYDLSNGQWDIPGLRELLQEILPQSNTLEDYQVEQDFEELGRRTMLLNARRIHDPAGTSERVLLSIEDITERKQFEDALFAADLHKNEFLAMLAHELRNPLAPLRSSVEVLRLLTGTGEPSTERGAASGSEAQVLGPDRGAAMESAVGMMERQIDQMVRLVDDLLDLSRISQGKMTLRTQRIDLTSVVREAVEVAQARCESAGLELTVALPAEPIYLDADPARLTQIVGNLLNNASKFTDRGGRIWLTVDRGRASRGRAAEVVLRVRDSGIGIASEELPRIFDMFVQVDASIKRSMDGLGIGLTLVKTLVEMHGGTVEVTSDGVGLGAEFVVRLPTVAAPEVAPPQPIRSEPVAAPALRILVVDDNRDAAESLAMLLQLTGHLTHIAYDGLEAVEAAARFEPDVILLDIGLPKLDGYEAARRIREQEKGRHAGLVALTGWGQSEDRRRSDEAGFDAHLVKPVDYEALVRLLAELKSRPIGPPSLRESEA